VYVVADVDPVRAPLIYTPYDATTPLDAAHETDTEVDVTCVTESPLGAAGGRLFLLNLRAPPEPDDSDPPPDNPVRDPDGHGAVLDTSDALAEVLRAAS
jgi:hypothetical protein